MRQKPRHLGANRTAWERFAKLTRRAIHGVLQPLHEGLGLLGDALPGVLSLLRSRQVWPRGARNALGRERRLWWGSQLCRWRRVGQLGLRRWLWWRRGAGSLHKRPRVQQGWP